MNSKRISLLLSTGFLAFPVLFFSCVNSPEEIDQVTQVDTLPDESTFEAVLLYTDSAKPKLKISAPELHRFQGDRPHSEFPSGIKLEVFDSEGKAETTLTADYGEHYEEEDRLEVRDNVVVVNKDGHTLYTEHLIWDDQNDQIISEKYVKIVTEDEIIFGNGLEANRDFSKYRIKKIKGTIKVKDDEEVQ